VPVEEVAAGVEDEAAAATRRLLAREPPPTALLAMSDRLARGALKGAGNAGLTVPAGLSVVGFDDDPGAERATPGLTTVRQPHVAKGRAAGDLLIARLEGQESTSPRILPTGLVVRGTTAPP
jgi:DNA-binding LacI/PurR family transcriptional regulator